MRIRQWSVIAIAALAAAGTALAASNPWVGTWKLDPSQSKLTGEVIHFTVSGDDVSYTAEGHTIKAKADGSTPTTTWSGAQETWKKDDDNTYESHATRNGTDLGTTTWTLSPDGKHLKAETKGTNPSGASFDDVEEYERVGSAVHGLEGSWKSTRTSLNETQTWEIAEKGPDELSWNIPAIKGVLDAKLDGKDYAPDGPTVPKGLTIALSRVSPRSMKLTEKMNGELLFHSTLTVSEDGKTITEIGTPAKSNATFREVWVKQ